MTARRIARSAGRMLGGTLRVSVWAVRLFLLVSLVVVLVYMFEPAVAGYHLGGCNPFIDHERTVRLGLEWWK